MSVVPPGSKQVATPSAAGASSAVQNSEFPLAPREGWLTLITLVVMIATLALAVDDAQWAGVAPGTRLSETKFLSIAAVLSVLLGAWLAKRPWRALIAQLVGAAVGAGFLLYAVSGSISRAAGIEGQLRDLNLSVATFIDQVFVQGSRSTETSVFLLLIGALVWGAGLLAAFNVFRRHRAMPGIVVAGLLLLLNVSVTVHDQYVYLIVFVLAALLLVMRLNLFDQAAEWRARGVRDLADVSGAFVRNGALMLVLAIGASILLAANASSAPLSRAWNNVDGQLLEIGYGVNRWLGGVSGAARGPNVLFTPSQTIRDFWEASPEPVFSATLSDGEGRRWRGATYDSFDGRTWSQLDRQSAIVDTGASLLDQTADKLGTGSGLEDVSATVTPAGFGGDVFVSPADPLSVDQPAEVVTNGANGPFVAAKLSYGVQPDVPYTVSAQIRITSGPGALSANELAAAGTGYSDWIRRYLDIRPGSVDDDVAALAQQILRSLPEDQRDPYHISVAVQDYLYRPGRFQYSTDVRGLCDGQNVVDCFLRIKKGYCEYFATTMVMLLRELGVPARYVVGYLPGIEQQDGSWLVQRSAAHAWVEVWFPGYGWLEFDPTPGNSTNGQAPTHLPLGAAVVRASAAPATPPDQQTNEDCLDVLSPRCLDAAGAGATDQLPPPDGPSVALPLAVGMLLLLGLGLLALAWLRRVPSTQPEIVFNSISRLAARLGYARQPSQTPYEYADHLGELVPVASGDLRLIAMAKVEATYGNRRPAESALTTIGDAYRRVRMRLLALVMRKPRSLRRGGNEPPDQ